MITAAPQRSGPTTATTATNDTALRADAGTAARTDTDVAGAVAHTKAAAAFLATVDAALAALHHTHPTAEFAHGTCKDALIGRLRVLLYRQHRLLIDWEETSPRT